MPRLGGAVDLPQVNDPASSTSGRQFLYFKSDGLLYTKNSAGVVTAIGSGISASIVDAKGDLILGTADNTVSRLAVGTNNFALLASSGAATGAAWTAIPNSIAVVNNASVNASTGAVTITNSLTPSFTSITAAGDITATVGNVYAKNTPSSFGYSAIQPGSATVSGLLAFYNASNVRQGYIGFGTWSTADAGVINYVGGSHSFTGTVIQSGRTLQRPLNNPATLTLTSDTLSTPKTSLIGHAGQANDIATGSAQGDIVLDAYSGRVFMPDALTVGSTIAFGSRGNLTSLTTASLLNHNVYWDGTNYRAFATGGGFSLGITPTSMTLSTASNVAAAAVTTLTTVFQVDATAGQASTDQLDLYLNGKTLLLGNDAAPPTPTSTQVSIYATGGRPKVKDGAGNTWDLDSPVVTRLTSAPTSTSTTNPPATVATELTQTLQPGTYEFALDGYSSLSVATIGTRLAFNFTGTQTQFVVGGYIAISSTASSYGYQTGINANFNGPTTGATTGLPFHYYGQITVTVAGDLQLKFGVSAAGTSTLAVGTRLRVKRIA